MSETDEYRIMSRLVLTFDPKNPILHANMETVEKILNKEGVIACSIKVSNEPPMYGAELTMEYAPLEYDIPVVIKLPRWLYEWWVRMGLTREVPEHDVAKVIKEFLEDGVAGVRDEAFM